jgi:hypothetical protein
MLAMKTKKARKPMDVMPSMTLDAGNRLSS